MTRLASEYRRAFWDANLVRIYHEGAKGFDSGELRFRPKSHEVHVVCGVKAGEVGPCLKLREDLAVRPGVINASKEGADLAIDRRVGGRA